MKLKLSKKSQKVIKEIMDERLFEHPLALMAKANVAGSLRGGGI